MPRSLDLMFHDGQGVRGLEVPRSPCVVTWANSRRTAEKATTSGAISRLEAGRAELTGKIDMRECERRLDEL